MNWKDIQLIVAAENGDFEAVNRLLEFGANPMSKKLITITGNVAIWQRESVAEHDTPLRPIEDKVQCESALALAIIHNHYRVVEALLRSSADPDEEIRWQIGNNSLKTKRLSAIEWRKRWEWTISFPSALTLALATGGGVARRHDGQTIHTYPPRSGNLMINCKGAHPVLDEISLPTMAFIDAPVTCNLDIVQLLLEFGAQVTQHDIDIAKCNPGLSYLLTRKQAWPQSPPVQAWEVNKSPPSQEVEMQDSVVPTNDAGMDVVEVALNGSSSSTLVTTNNSECGVHIDVDDMLNAAEPDKVESQQFPQSVQISFISLSNANDGEVDGNIFENTANNASWASVPVSRPSAQAAQLLAPGNSLSAVQTVQLQHDLWSSPFGLHSPAQLQGDATGTQPGFPIRTQGTQLPLAGGLSSSGLTNASTNNAVLSSANQLLAQTQESINQMGAQQTCNPIGNAKPSEATQGYSTSPIFVNAVASPESVASSVSSDEPGQLILGCEAWLRERGRDEAGYHSDASSISTDSDGNAAGEVDGDAFITPFGSSEGPLRHMEPWQSAIGST
ncbi:hypothetical protein M427DRAFT_133894 [Gonapodya prolifera JEL478]|uniref:Ankyrin n=1 Tax=Gonapodya prolifera (strain JEL478) TaxID=1344416 RepID=A0A139AJA0_GONPJ|nr:hypothetical protein M427DRAFT_133894 [Gonapodya prolifera JEL478]|eukprot:KXS16819.1 hypothetical protein M427DRAFT_133894 [Gonapodya prolifera JEL478]